MAGTRLDRLVSHLTGLSRKDAAALIKAGRAEVAGAIIKDPAFKVAENAAFSIDGELEGSGDLLERKRYFMVNKPKGCVCADHDRLHPVVIDLFAEELNPGSLHCAGRLDIDTTGLLIVTDDGDLNHAVTAPRREVSKTYLAVTDKPIDPSLIERFASGLKHPSELKRYQPAKLEIAAEREGLVTVSEGRYHEVKRLFELCGLEVVELKRLAIGRLQLDDSLDEGEYRPLDEEELKLLFAKPAQ